MKLPELKAPGDAIYAEDFNALIDAIGQLANPRVEAPLKVKRGKGGVPVLALQGDDYAVFRRLTIIAGPDSAVPADPATVKYTFQVYGSDVTITNRAPDWGRPFDQSGGNSPFIYPAPVGTPALLFNFNTKTGSGPTADVRPEGLIWIPFGGSGAGGNFKGERLHTAPCPGQSESLTMDQLVEILAEAVAGRIRSHEATQQPSNAVGPEGAGMLVRQQAQGRLFLKLDGVGNAQEDRGRVDVPAEAVACTITGALAAGASGIAWTNKTIYIKARIGQGPRVHFKIVKQIPPGGGIEHISEGELAGVTQLVAETSGNNDATGSQAELNFGFIVMTPRGSTPPQVVATHVVSGAAAPVAPAAASGEGGRK